MKRLSIRCFGPPHAEIEGAGSLQFQTEKSFDLLVVAALGGKSQTTRTQAAALLRMDQSETMARRALSTDLWRLRKAFSDIGAESSHYLVSTHRGIGIAPEANVYFDLREFEAGFDALVDLSPDTLKAHHVEKLAALAELYCDDALPDHDQEWSFVLRERLRSKYMALVDMLLQHALAADDWIGGIRWAKLLLELDPMLEHAHRAVMQCHFLTGNRAVAIRQYTECTEILRRELGVEPSEETMRMYRGLLSVQIAAASQGPAPRKSDAPNTSLGLREADRKRPLTDQLAMALGNLNQARSLVENVDGALRRRDH